jgi:DUF4097 and DUF4098 domain-containing protein YvlB
MLAQILSLLFAPILAFASFTLQAQAPSRTVTRTEPLAMGAKLWIKQVDGRIELQGWDRPEVSLVADFHDGSRGEKAELEVRTVSEGLEIEVRIPRHRLIFGFHRSPVCNLTLKVPRKLNVAARAVDGDISVRDLEGYARCETVDGRIRVENLKGEAYVHAVDGAITARNLNARLKGGTVDGPIELEKVEGGIELKTVDGRIRANGLDGWGEGIRLETVDGSIHVTLGAATGRLDARTGDGAIRHSLGSLEVQEAKERVLRGRIPGREQEIRLRTVDGGIRID